MDKIISNTIVETCKKLGIYYKSVNPNYITYTNDAQQLLQLYRDLIEISAKLKEISERHDIPELKQMLQFDVETLTKIDHDLIKLARKLKEKEC